MFETLQPRNAHESAGIGLTLFRRIVGDRGGQTSVESSPGHWGACFRFTWPRRASGET